MAKPDTFYTPFPQLTVNKRINILDEFLSSFLKNQTLMKMLLVILLWCILFTLSAPLAIGLFFLLAFFWLILLPFRIVGFTLGIVLKIAGAVLLFPFKLLGLH